jgi:hypothetical protein
VYSEQKEEKDDSCGSIANDDAALLLMMMLVTCDGRFNLTVSTKMSRIYIISYIPSKQHAFLT